MIPKNSSLRQVPDWQMEIAQAISDPIELLRLLEISPIPKQVLTTKQAFPLRVPISYVNRMQKGMMNDPLLQQVLPVEAEYQINADYSDNPVGDLETQASPGLLHKYSARVLLITTAACAGHCRYCFRRHFPYHEHKNKQPQWLDALTYIQLDDSIKEVILSGGDPLNLSDKRLAQLIQKIEQIPHVTTLRIHSRTPIFVPSRITTIFVDLLARSRLTVVLVTHINHPNEINAELTKAFAALTNISNVTLLNQSVLLKGINDHSQVLIQLSHTLFQIGILPYYLHTLDYVQGAAHFQTDHVDIKSIYLEMRKNLPGYLVPKLVKEATGEPFKLDFLNIESA